MDLIIVTGMSGAGKTACSHILEDMGYYCVDGMPTALYPAFTDLCRRGCVPARRVALITGIRGEGDFSALYSFLEGLRGSELSYKLLFLDCGSGVLLNRYKETRRVHPLITEKGLSLEDAIHAERRILLPLRDRADYTLDTSALSLSQLRDELCGMISGIGQGTPLVTVMSFGYKYGIAGEADLVFDVRNLPNPYYVPELKSLTGLDKPVSDYVLSFPETQEFLKRFFDTVDWLLSCYTAGGKAQVTVAVGCTGGKHRSVTVAEALASRLRERYPACIVRHRDVNMKFTGDK